MHAFPGHIDLQRGSAAVSGSPGADIRNAMGGLTGKIVDFAQDIVILGQFAFGLEYIGLRPQLRKSESEVQDLRDRGRSGCQS